jgi:hypothetical protein
MTSKHVGFHVIATSVYVFSTLGSADVYFHSFKLVLLSVQTTFKYTESQHGHHPLFRGETWSSRTVFPAHPNAAVSDVIRADNRSTFRKHLHLTKRNKIHSPKPKVESQVDFRSAVREAGFSATEPRHITSSGEALFGFGRHFSVFHFEVFGGLVSRPILSFPFSFLSPLSYSSLPRAHNVDFHFSPAAAER